MAKKEIKILQNQINKLGEKHFDFEAWKEYSLLILARIFGNNDPKVKQLKQIEFEYNSWSLRDASGNQSYEESSKKLASEILQAAIDELDLYGVPINMNKDSVLVQELVNIILDEMKGSQVKSLKSILSSNENITEKQRLVEDLIKDLGENSSIEILSKILTNQQLSSILID